jgi:hypothetical protein
VEKGVQCGSVANAFQLFEAESGKKLAGENNAGKST